MNPAVPTPRASTPKSFSTADVARLLGVTPARVRAIVRAGLCRPARQGRRFQFTFQDIVLLRTAHGLLKVRVPPRRVRRALTELARQLPAARPLSGVRIYADRRHVLVRDGRTAWQPENGQVVFTFGVDELARAAGVTTSTSGRAARAPVRSVDTGLDSEDWFERALEREERNDREGARAAYQRAIELDPQLSDAYINLGRLAHEDGNVPEAARLYHLAVSCEPDDPIAHYDLAIALEDQGNGTAAVAHYQRAINLDPHFADAHFNVGRLLDRLGRRTQALRHLLVYKKLTRSKSS